MAENGYAPGPGHVGRIPNFGKTQVNPMGSAEPPACIQNAMMTKDKKPFTYTPGGLDLSQIKTPSMARRLARQRSQEEHEQAYAQVHGGHNYHPQGGPVPPPPPPPSIPAPPPPPPLVIEAPNSKSVKPIPLGERPEIVIPENPIGMLRKTNSPYHWESEQADMQRMGPVPKFQEKVPSPLTVKMPPSSFAQHPPQAYGSPGLQNNAQRQNYSYGGNNQAPESPIHRPEAQYAHQKSASPNVNGSPLTRELLQRQDSQFNKSPQPFAGQPPISNGSPYSPTPNNNWRASDRRDSPANSAHSPQSPQNRNQFSPNVQQQQYSPNIQQQQYSPNAQQQQQFSPNVQQQQYSPNVQQQQYSPNVQQQRYPPNVQQQQFSPNYQSPTPVSNSSPAYHTLPRNTPKLQDNLVSNSQNNNSIYNNTRDTQSPKVDPSNPAPWRTNTLNRYPRDSENIQNIYHNTPVNNQQPTYTPPWAVNNNSHSENSQSNPWKQENKVGSQQQQYNPWSNQDVNNNTAKNEYNPPWKTPSGTDRPAPPSPSVVQHQEPRYQSTMSIPVTPRKQNPQPENSSAPQKEIVYVNQEPVYFCPDSPKAAPAWVKTQKEKTKTPPPEWCQRPLEGRKSAPRELVTPPRDNEPEWVKKSNEMQRGVREVISPPKYQQPVQPTWSTRPSENRKSQPRDNVPAPGSPGSRVIPIQMEISTSDNRDQNRYGGPPPPLKIAINLQSPNMQSEPASAPYSQPTQRIMRVLSPQLVRLDDKTTQPELPTLNKNFQSSQDSQPKTRIIPIQIEGGSGGANKSVYYHKFTQEGPPRQSKAFRVLQVITGTQDDVYNLNNVGYTDL